VVGAVVIAALFYPLQRSQHLAALSDWTPSGTSSTSSFNRIVVLQEVAMRFWLWSVLLVLLPSLMHSGHSILTNNIFSFGSIVGLDTIRDILNMRPHFLGTFIVDVLLLGV
jgi:hypothetical protein